MKRFLFLFLLGTMGAYAFRQYAYEGIYVASASMEPEFPVGTHVMVNKYTLMFHAPKRGQVVMFDSPVDPQKGMIKRVIAVGGDTVEIKKKQVVVNGAPIAEPYVQHTNPDVMYVGDNIAPIQVPAGHVFVMGDNRDVSGDSRDWRTPEKEWIPFLPIEKIKGLVR